MMAVSERTHADYVSEIGRTNAAEYTTAERGWARYYDRSCRHVVERMLEGTRRGVLLDVGTSHGHWLGVWQQAGFGPVLGVELDAERAEQARAAGFDEVYNCDAVSLPIEDESVDVAVSNDVFVHILRTEDKRRVIGEVARVLRPGGALILNHPMSQAFGSSGETIDRHCSFLDLSGFLALASEAPDLELTDVKPTYYHFRNGSQSPLTRLARKLAERNLPVADRVLFALDYRHARDLPLQDSDTVYLKFVKRPN
jgi:ubiquinone/menaquinone biosynthesis C-methylase UbiE